MTPAYEKLVRFDPVTRDFAMYLDGDIVGYRSTYREGEIELDRLVADKLAHQQHQQTASVLAQTAHAAGDTSNARALNKAALKLAEGIAPRHVHSDEYLVPSANDCTTVYRVSAARGCSCEAGAHGRACWHSALVEIITATVFVVPEPACERCGQLGTMSTTHTAFCPDCTADLMDSGLISDDPRETVVRCAPDCTFSVLDGVTFVNADARVLVIGGAR